MSDERVRPGRECRVCGEDRRAEMVRGASYPDGHQKICRACARASTRAYRLANPDKNAASQKRWADKNRSRKNAYLRQWTKDNPERAKAISDRRNHARRAAVNESPCPNFTANEWAEALEAADYRCIVCASPDEIEYGHLIPIKAHGGCNAIHNVAPLCRECNRGRGGQHSRLFWEWLPERLAYLEGLTCSPSRTRSPVLSA